MAMISAHAAWHMGAWEDMRKYVSEVEGSDITLKVRSDVTHANSHTGTNTHTASQYATVSTLTSTHAHTYTQ